MPRGTHACVLYLQIYLFLNVQAMLFAVKLIVAIVTVLHLEKFLYFKVT